MVRAVAHELVAVGPTTMGGGGSCVTAMVVAAVLVLLHPGRPAVAVTDTEKLLMGQPAAGF